LATNPAEPPQIKANIQLRGRYRLLRRAFYDVKVGRLIEVPEATKAGQIGNQIRGVFCE